MDSLAGQSDKFKELLQQINEEVSVLKNTIRQLKRENAGLKTKLEEARSEQTDIFSAINESERLAMRQQIMHLVEKIDQHLNTES